MGELVDTPSCPPPTNHGPPLAEPNASAAIAAGLVEVEELCRSPPKRFGFSTYPQLFAFSPLDAHQLT